MSHYISINKITCHKHFKDIIQGKIIYISEMLKTKSDISFFFIIISDRIQQEKNKISKKSDNDDFVLNPKYVILENDVDNLKQKESDEIKIMFWDKQSTKWFNKIKKNKTYNFCKLNVQPSYKHKHTYQLTVTNLTTITPKKYLNYQKKSTLYVADHTKHAKQKQTCIQNYFRKY